MKVCFKCNVEKPLSEYYKHSQMKDGHVNKCKECNKKDVRTNYRDNIDYYKDYEKSRAMLPHRVKSREDYTKTENGKKSKAKSTKRYRTENSNKSKAHSLVNNAIRDGRITKKGFCESCGDTKKRLHAHHDDYAKPLDVRFLCPQCHVNWHKENGEGLNA
jgi:hypothetical protein